MQSDLKVKDAELCAAHSSLELTIGVIEIKKKGRKVVSVKLPPSPQHHSALLRVLLRCPLPGGERARVRGYKDLLALTPDLEVGTPFQQKVWRYIRKIPYGHTVTYKKIADDLRVGKAYRAVGQACRSNPMPIVIPCHRVVSCNGKLGGYSSGCKWKKFLLGLEKGRT